MEDLIVAGQSGKADVADKFLSMLQSVPHTELDDSAIAALVDIFNKWMKGSNFKVKVTSVSDLHWI